MVDIVVIKLKYYQNKQGFIPTNVFLETYEFLFLLDEIKTTLVEIFTYYYEISTALGRWLTMYTKLFSDIVIEMIYSLFLFFDSTKMLLNVITRMQLKITCESQI